MNPIVRYFTRPRNNSLAENVLLCIAISLAGSFLYYERHMPFSDVLRFAVTILIFVVWGVCAFSAGRKKSVGFPVLTVLYWAIPYIFIVYYNSRDNLNNYSKWLAYFNKLADMVFCKSFSEFAKNLGTNPLVIVAMLLIVTAAMFFIGMKFPVKKIGYRDGEDPDEYDEDEYDDEYDDEQDISYTRHRHLSHEEKDDENSSWDDYYENNVAAGEENSDKSYDYIEEGQKNSGKYIFLPQSPYNEDE